MPRIETNKITPGTVIQYGSGLEPHLVANQFWLGNQDCQSLFLLDKHGKVITLKGTQIPAQFETLPEVLPVSFRDSLHVKDNVRKAMVSSPGERWMYIGTDPEVFAVDPSGAVIPAFVYLGPKDTGVVGPQAFYDGFQAEWTTSASTCLGHQTDYVRAGMQRVLLAAQKVCGAAKLSHRSVVDIAFDPEFSKDRYQLGCSPSMNAYDEPSVLVGSPELLPFRSAGWHMHFCQNDDNGRYLALSKETAAKIIRLEDAILGTALVSFGQGYHDVRRRLMYGRAGEYRFGKTLEYRVPEVLMGCHPATWNLFWDLGRAVYWLGLRGFDFIWDAEPDEVRSAINNSDVALAQKILHRNLVVLEGMLTIPYGPEPAKVAVNAILAGVDSIVADPTNLAHNWWLDRPHEWRGEGMGRLPGSVWRTAYPILSTGGKL